MLRLSTTFLLTLFLLTGLQAQKVVYRYRFGPTLGDHLKKAVDALAEGREITARASMKVEMIRSDFFTALQTNAPDLKAKEDLFYDALLNKDLIILLDYKSTYRYYKGEPPANFQELFFGKVDNGIHPSLQKKFELFAHAYMKHENDLTNGNLLSLDSEVFFEALNRSVKEYESYRIGRDWLEFERQGVRVADGKDRHKLLVVALTNVLSEKAYTVTESEKIYEAHATLMGGYDKMNAIYDLIQKVLTVTEKGTKVELDRLAPAEQNQLYENVLQFYFNREEQVEKELLKEMPYTNRFIEKVIPHLKEGSAEKFILFHLYAYTECHYEAACAVTTLKKAQLAFGKEKVDEVMQTIFTRERKKGGLFYAFVEPFVVEGETINAPHVAFIPLLAENDKAGFVNFLCQYSPNGQYKSIEDLRIFGEEKLELAVRRTFATYLKQGARFHQFAWDRLIKELENDIIDFTEEKFRELPDSGTNFYKFQNYVLSQALPSDTLVIFTNMPEKVEIDPGTWTSAYTGEHIQGIAHGVCRLYQGKTTPEVVNVRFFYDSQLVFQYTLEKKTGYTLVSYERQGAKKSSDITGAFSKYNMPCLYKE